MKVVKTSKFKNSALLFELLANQVTDDTVKDKTSPAVEIIRKYFSKTELLKEYLLYQTIAKANNLSEAKADILLNSVLLSYSKLDKKVLKEQKYNLVKEIKAHYNDEEFFRTNIPSYRLNGAIYTLFELNNDQISTNPNQLIQVKSNLIEHLTKDVKSDVDTEWNSLDRGTKNLTFKIMVESFNNTFKSYNDKQKNILKEYVKCISTPSEMRPVLNSTLLEVKQELITQYKVTTEVDTKIKLKEVINKIVPFKKDTAIKDSDVVNTLYYCELLSELTNANKSN